MMYDRRDELSLEVLERAAREALERPQPSAMWDHRLYMSHGCVMSWAERGDDILEESNYLCVLEHLRGIAVQSDGDAQGTPDEYVIDATCSHWLVGSLRQLFVQVYDEDGEFTETFKEAVCIAYALRDYPVFDESDYSEREYEAYERVLDDAIASVQGDYLDAPLEEEHLATMTRERIGEAGEWSRPDDVRETVVAEVYEEVRNAYFEERAQEYLDAMAQERTRQIDGQSSLL